MYPRCTWEIADAVPGGKARPGMLRSSSTAVPVKSCSMRISSGSALNCARHQHLSHAAFLELVLADEATRRDTSSTAPRARAAGLDPAMRLDTWDEAATVRYDRTLWTDLTSLRFLDAAHGAVVLGAVGVGKTHLTTALGHIAVRRRIPTLMLRADAMVQAAAGISPR